MIQTNPLLDKLAVYAGLEVPEVWVFRDGAFEMYRLTEGAYRRIDRSVLIPDLDLAIIARFAIREDQHAALMELRDELRRG